MTKPSSLLSLFKEQLENESRQLAEARGVTERGPWLQWWYFSRLVGLEASRIEEISCDGPNDLGIDALWLDPEGVAHFYQFKNPERPDMAFPTGEVDKVVSGLGLILERKHAGIANLDLAALVEEIYQTVPSGYRLHLVTSGTGLNADAIAKLNAFVGSLNAPDGFLAWTLEDLPSLQDAFYQKTLPTVEEPIELTLDQPPYTVRSANHDSYLCHTNGAVLAALYDSHSEQLLQQNIRVYQGDRATNAVIRKSCAGGDSASFFHYNNGVTFLCERAVWDPFTRKVTMTRAQIVNGGQTIRVLHAASSAGALKADVLVPIRIITSQGDKAFANNVAVNLNNQNRIEPSFLRSNDPRVIQLANSLASLGWYLERREDEVSAMAKDERAGAEARIGRTLDGHVIRLKEGMQAYVATFMRQPELAKKNPKRIFLGAGDGGSFDRVFGGDLTADGIVAAHRLGALVEEHVRQFMTRKRRKERVANWSQDYALLLGEECVEQHADVIDQVVPQSAVFLAAATYELIVRVRGESLDAFLDSPEVARRATFNEVLREIMRHGKGSPQFAQQSWPTLLKSQTFFENLGSYFQGARAGAGRQS